MVVAVAYDPLLVDDYHCSRRGADTRHHGAVGLCDRLVDVRQQRHVQAMLGGEVLVRGDALRGDSDDRGVQRGKVLGVVAIGAELLLHKTSMVGANRSQYNRFAPLPGGRMSLGRLK